MHSTLLWTAKSELLRREEGELVGCLLPNPCAAMLRGAAGASLVAARERKRVSKTAKRGGASRALAALGRSARQPFTAEANAQLRDAIIAKSYLIQ